MSTTTDIEEIETALEACDGVETVDSHTGIPKIDVFLAADTRTTEPLEPILDEYELRIWTVNFDWENVTVVPADSLAYPDLGDEWPAGRSPSLEDRFELIDAVSTSEPLVSETAPRLRYWVTFDYGTESLHALTEVLADTKLAVYSVDFTSSSVILAPPSQITYSGGDGQ